MNKKYSDNPQVNVRMPEALLNRLRIAAEEAGRTLQAEIISRLDESFPLSAEESFRVREQALKSWAASVELLRDRLMRKRDDMSVEQIEHVEREIAQSEANLAQSKADLQETKALHALVEERLRGPIERMKELTREATTRRVPDLKDWPSKD